MSNSNLRYSTEEIVDYYSTHRNRWAEFYPSEQAVFESLMPKIGPNSSVLDVGCAAGGLGRALGERFGIGEYVGVDIHVGVIEAGREMGGFHCPVRLLAGDITELPVEKYNYDLVVSLSCVDWNVRTFDIVKRCWQYVRPGGYFVLTLRLTPGQGCNNIGSSFQYIHFSDVLPDNWDNTEKAPYVVFNTMEALSMLAAMNPKPSSIMAKGYWGAPSITAVTPYDRLIFSALAIRKPREDISTSIMADFNLPLDAFWDYGQGGKI